MTIKNLEFDQSSAAEQVAKALREYLLQGEIPPGAKLQEVALARALGVSRHTLRAGFRILEAEGLLEHALHRGVVVPELSDDRIADVFRARKALEFTGIHSVDLGEESNKSMTRMAEAVGRMKAARSDGELAAADLEFHSAVVAAVNSRMIDELYRNIQAQLRLTGAWAQRSRGNRGLMAETHGEVVQLLRNNEVEKAAEALMRINVLGEERLLEAMRQLNQPEKAGAVVWPPDHE